MAITSLDQWVAAQKQKIEMTKTAARTTVANLPFSLYELAGTPGAGTLAGTNPSTTGAVPTDATAGHPIINAFAGGATGYLGSVSFDNTVASRIELHDLLWKAGTYTAAAATVAVSAPASFSSRVPGGTDFKETEVWIECVTAHTGILSVNITYTNQDGVASKTTGVISVGTAMTLGRMFKMPLAAGDTGVQAITQVVSSVATAGTFNVLVTRPLWKGRVTSAGFGDTHDFLKTGAPQVFADSAFMMIVQADSTSSGVPSLLFDVVSG